MKRKDLCWLLVGWSLFLLVFAVKTQIDPVKASVYPAFSGGSRDWWAGRPVYGNLGYYYSPTFAVAISPFAVLPDRFGGVLFVAVSMALLWYALRRVIADVADNPALAARFGRWTPAMETAFMALVGFGCLRGLWSAQSNALLLAMVLIAASAIIRKQWWLAADMLAAPVYIKVWPLAVAALIVVQWPKQLAPRFVAAMTALALAPFLTKSPGVTVGYYRDWIDWLRLRQNDGVRWGGYRDAYTIWEQFGEVDRRAYMLLQLGAAAAVLCWCLWQWYQGRSQQQRLLYTIAAWSCWQLLLGPGTERLTYGLVAPAMAWAIVTCYHRRHLPGMRAAFYLAATSYVIVYLIGAGHLEHLIKPYTTWVMTLEPLGILLFVGWLVSFAQLSGNEPEALSIPEPSIKPRLAKKQHDLHRAAA